MGKMQYQPVFFLGEGEVVAREGLPRSRYRLSESALPDELDEEVEEWEDTLLAECDREAPDRTDRE